MQYILFNLKLSNSLITKYSIKTIKTVMLHYETIYFPCKTLINTTINEH